MGSSLAPEASRSVAFFCHTCGEVWGRVVVEGATWNTASVPCKEHQPLGVFDWLSLPGSFLNQRLWAEDNPIWNRANCLDYLPESVLQYEFELAVKAYFEKEDEE
jgi:hypothetical protein